MSSLPAGLNAAARIYIVYWIVWALSVGLLIAWFIETETNREA